MRPGPPASSTYKLVLIGTNHKGAWNLTLHATGSILPTVECGSEAYHFRARDLHGGAGAHVSTLAVQTTDAGTAGSDVLLLVASVRLPS